MSIARWFARGKVTVRQTCMQRSLDPQGDECSGLNLQLPRRSSVIFDESRAKWLSSLPAPAERAPSNRSDDRTRTGLRSPEGRFRAREERREEEGRRGKQGERPPPVGTKTRKTAAGQRRAIEGRLLLLLVVPLSAGGEVKGRIPAKKKASVDAVLTRLSPLCSLLIKWQPAAAGRCRRQPQPARRVDECLADTDRESVVRRVPKAAFGVRCQFHATLVRLLGRANLSPWFTSLGSAESKLSQLANTAQQLKGNGGAATCVASSCRSRGSASIGECGHKA